MTSELHRGTPKYYVLKEELLSLIKGAEPGTLIPTERALAEQYSISRTTVRQAIGELVAEGQLDRTQGSGTFVSKPKLVYVRQLTSFSEDATLQGKSGTSRVLDVSRAAADAETSERLQVALGTLLHRVERVRLVDGEPLAHDTALLPGPLPGLADHITETSSLYGVLRDIYGIEISEVEDMVETTLAGPDNSRLLGIEMSAPLLLVHRLGSAGGKPVEWTRTVFRGDRFRFVARMCG